MARNAPFKTLAVWFGAAKASDRPFAKEGDWFL